MSHLRNIRAATPPPLTRKRAKALRQAAACPHQPEARSKVLRCWQKAYDQLQGTGRPQVTLRFPSLLRAQRPKK